MYDGLERRKYKRIKKNFIAKFRVIPPEAEKNIFGHWNMVTVQNFGAGGVLFNHDKRVEIGSLIDLKINFPMSRNPIDCVAKVIRIDEANHFPIFSIAAVFMVIDKQEKEIVDKAAEEFYSKKKQVEYT